MPRREGLRPISEQMEKIRERLEKERERRKNKNKPIRIQPRLPGMKKGGTSELGKQGTLKRKFEKLSIEELKKELDPTLINRPPKQPPKMPMKKKGGQVKKGKGILLIIGKRRGGITGKEPVGELVKRYGSLKKGIRLKGKGSSFMKEYKKRVYGKAAGGSVNGGVRGTGIAVKGKHFKGVF